MAIWLPDGGNSQVNRKLRPCFYSALSHITGIKNDEIKKRISEFVVENPERILTIVRKIALKTGSNLNKMDSQDLIDLVESSSEHRLTSVLSFLKDEDPKIAHRHLANFILAEVCSYLFEINITLRDFAIHYDPISGGAIVELWRIEALASKEAPTLNLMQGCAFLHGALDLRELSIIDIAPQEIISKKKN